MYPLFIERQVRVIKYWLKLIKLNNDKGIFVNSIYKELFQLSISQPRAVTWATRVRDTLYRCNLKSTRARKKAGFRPLFLLPVNVETWNLEQMIFSFIPKSHKNSEVLAPI